MKTEDTHKSTHTQEYTHTHDRWKRIAKLLKPKAKKKILSRKRKKRHMTLNGATLKLMFDLSTKIWNPEDNRIHF